MLWFVLRFVIWSLLLLSLVYFEDYSPFYFVNVLQTDATNFIMALWVNLFDVKVQLADDTVVFRHGLKLLILNECNGLVPFFLYVSGLLAYPTLYMKKFKWLLVGMVTLLTLNMIRIIMITLVVIDYPDSFELAHHIVGRYSVGAVTLYLFYYFTTHVETLVPYGIILNSKWTRKNKNLKDKGLYYEK